MEEFDYQDLQAATDGFSLSRLMGKGSHGCVYKGVLRDGKLVAVKKPSLGLEILQDNSMLDNETKILSSLRRSPYIVNLFGVSTHEDSNKKKLLVMEFMPNGSLHDLLHNVSTPPTWSKRAVIALQIARAVQFLHEAKPYVIHRDIKSPNILFDSNWNAKLADFGLAVRQSDPNLPILSLSQPAGTIGYLDPCYTTPSKLSTKNDVFSFGVVLLEIISSTQAIDVGREPASIVEWALPLIQEDRVMEVCDKRVALPTNMETTIRCILNIAARCVSSEEERRPSMGEIAIELENCVVQRVRLPVWVSIFSSIRFRRRRKIATQTTTILCTKHEEDAHLDLPRRKLLIREVLADMTLK
ncbi:hypothetical protein HHK36_009121 [Tetracentron sinense]|uniref:non-specific serine/threonine protein kinase n=1 Tax=Tetracentron sinense TaxID=13715 RepID=A0A835DLC9_TETSI|nr:hypothetical protein HHK36_009121 [Tetracentron sinense]